MSERHELPSGTNPALRARFDRLSSAEQARVLARLDARNQNRVDSFHIPRRNERRAPLTYAQQGIWFRQQLAPESSVWNLSRTWAISGPLDIGALERALSEIVRRHESLRTRYLVVHGEPAQEAVPAAPFVIERLDVREPASGGRQAALDFRDRLAARAFDLASPVMLRAGLATLGPEQYELTITRHHICSDQWSSGILRRELSTVYNDAVAGRASSLPDLRLQFNDYAWWENDAARRKSTDAALAEAVEMLQGMPDESALVASADRHASASGPGGRVSGAIPAPVVRRLRTLALSQDATLFMALMAIFNAVVCRLTNQTDLVVVTPTAGRVHPELESLIGQFSNVLPVRTDLTGDPPFLDLLARVQQGTTRLFAHQHVPIQRLQSALRPGWTGARMAITSLLFALQNMPHDDLRLTGTDLQVIESGPHEAFEDLSLFASEDTDGALALRAHYRADRVHESTIRRLVDDFAAIAALVVDRPATRLSELSAEARGRVIDQTPACHDTAADYPRDACVQEMVERQVERTPDATAVVDGATRVTFRELNRRANRLAHHLRTKGAAPDTVVGLCLGRSVDLVVALLGILKSGAAYLPIDSTLPDERLRFILSASGAGMCVTTAALAHRLADLIPLVTIDADRPSIDGMSDENPARTGTAEDLAYVMFTSGSTGRPKGVAMPHRPLVNLLSWHARHPRLGQPACTLQFAPVTFDVSFQDIVGTWCTGGTVVMIDDDARRDPMALRQFVEEHAIERLYLPAAALKSLAQAHAVSPRPLSRLRDIIAAGEALHVTPEIRRFAADAPACHLHNHYGPTEAHVVAAHEIDGPAEAWPAAVPIGRPLSNVHIEILNEDRQRVAADVAGELHIGGDCLARGYVGRPDLTAERFIDDPFRPGLRLYRSGDRGRARPDGTLEFLGRLDDQVKLVGYRVEPGEIEAVMAECPGVSQAVVVIREDRPDDKRLVGYYVASAAAAVTPGALQAQLRQRLPRYMLPAALVELTALPLSPNGKIDRLALPRPATDRTARDAAARPTDPVEASLVALWSDVLGCTGIGIDDNFFDLGGHSILAATMLLRAEQTLGRAPGLSVLFEGPTIRQLAHAFRGQNNQAPRMVLTWITDATSGEDRGRKPLIVMPSMFGAVAEWRPFFEGLAVDRPIFGLELLGDASYWTAEPTLQEIAAHCVEVLLRDLTSRHFHLIGHSFGGRLAYEVGQQLDAAGRAPDSIVILDTPTTGATRRMQWRDVRSMVANAPGWVKNELEIYGATALAQRLRNRWRFRLKAQASGLDGIFDVSRFTEGYKRRLLDSHRAFTAYRAGPSGNRVVYLRSQVRSLIHSHRPDGGWGDFVPAPHLTIVPIPGDHGSALFARRRDDVAAAIRQALQQAENY